ncbi:YicC/YloC family endoribonuclease [Abyssisolibacter fermentans]|uniref:YicC/YloC family endoribonuclease n=1 Tax=Abyssisolibacter fermentans TaxID=1766203 RepID=UPI00082FB09F|nr:YicC/YloC family endoribonuclease [Abyssisolibacter fermentans]
MIKSMTGFGRGESSDNKRRFTVEIRAINHKYNDIIVKKPKTLNYLEERIKKTVKEKMSRGRIEIFVSMENISDEDVFVKPDVLLAKSYKSALDVLADELNINNDVTISSIMRFQDIFRIEKAEEDEEEIWLCLSIAVKNAINEVLHMRTVEGEKLAEDIVNRSNIIKAYVKEIEKFSDEVIIEYKTKLRDRIKELLDNVCEIDENKLANEVAFYADRSNITEEIVRLYSHIEQLLNTIKSDKSVGRKLDFIIQEMNREANTIGSKSADIKITNLVVEIKSELEKIREQVQNIE